MPSNYFEVDHVEDALRYAALSRYDRHNCIYPVYRNRFLGFLWRRTHWKCCITGWECNGKIYDKDTPKEDMLEPGKPVVFRRYIKLPEVKNDDDGST